MANRDERLPFRRKSSCSMGIAMLNYLDFHENDESMSKSQRVTASCDKVKKWFSHSDIDRGLEDAFLIWDTVSLDALVDDPKR